jgi:FKBP-type peptidyl-prolyl cis-trans isomerase SlyD
MSSTKEVSVAYTLTSVQSGKKLEDIPEGEPAIFVLGKNQLLPDFEKKLQMLKPGDTFDFTILAENAYGPSDPYAIFDVPLDTFEEKGKIDEKMVKIGNVIPMTDNQGNKHFGEIIAIGNNAVTLDFNHPLAGQDLQFTGKLISTKL